jgi:F-box domain
MKDQKQNLQLSELPPELVVIILKNLPDFDSLFATIQTCWRLYGCFQKNALSIITSISSNVHQRAIQLDRQDYQVKPFPNRGSCLIFRQLNFAIEHNYIHRDFVLQMFKNAWTFLHDKRLEEILIPLGRKLAWSLSRDNRQKDAMDLALQILRGKPPFKLSGKPPRQTANDYMWSAPIFAPLDYLIFRIGPVDSTLPQEIVSKEIERQIHLKYERLHLLPVVLITDDGMLFFKSSIYLPRGIYSESGITLVRLTNPPRRVRGLREVKQPRDRYRRLLQLENMSYLDSAR